MTRAGRCPAEGSPLGLPRTTGTTSTRVSFAKIREPLEVPNLLHLQTTSFDWLVGNDAWQAASRRRSTPDATTCRRTPGLEEIFEEISPIEDFSGSMSLSFRDHRFEPTKYSVEECKDKDMTYAAPLFVTAEFTNNTTGEIKSQTVFMGDFPMMTPKGTFVINGTERVVVSQLVRSPGVYFDKQIDKVTDKDTYSCKVIPSRGAWLEFEVDKRDAVGVRIDRKRKQPVTVLLKALGWDDARILERYGDYESMRMTLEKDHTTGQDDALIDIYRKLRPGEPPTRESAQTLLENLFFNGKRYDLAKVGRYKVNKKLGLELPVDQGVLTEDDVLATIDYVVKLHAGEAGYETDDIDHFGNRRLRTVGELIQNQIRLGLARMERVVRERMTTQDVEAITPQTLINIRPVVASIKEFFGTSQLSQFMDQTNPLSGLTHKRRLSALGPGGLSRERAGFEVRDVHPSHYGRCARSRPRRPEHRPDRLAGDLRPGQRLRLRRDAVPQGDRRRGDRPGRLPHRRRGGQARHRAGERAGRLRQLRRQPRAGAQEGRRGRLHRPVRRRLHRRQPAPDLLGRDRDDPVPRARRRQPRAHGVEHDAPGRPAAAQRGAAGRHRHGAPRRRRRR
jgi:DNA-directed RNA polymerase subunit beta